MHTRRALRGGFTLIELMIVVAIIGILASIAIPTFIRYQFRSRSAEASMLIRAIVSAEFSYFAHQDIFLPVVPTPDGIPNNYKVNWNSSSAGFSDFEDLGFRPEGAIYFRYSVDVDPTYTSAFAIVARGDLDANGIFQDWAFIHPDTGGQIPATIQYGVLVAPEFREQVTQVTAVDVY